MSRTMTIAMTCTITVFVREFENKPVDDIVASMRGYQCREDNIHANMITYNATTYDRIGYVMTALKTTLNGLHLNAKIEQKLQVEFTTGEREEQNAKCGVLGEDDELTRLPSRRRIVEGEL